MFYFCVKSISNSAPCRDVFTLCCETTTMKQRIALHAKDEKPSLCHCCEIVQL